MTVSPGSDVRERLTTLAGNETSCAASAVDAAGGAVTLGRDGLRAKFDEVRALAQSIPAELLDMHQYHIRQGAGRCGCVLTHYEARTNHYVNFVDWPLKFKIPDHDWSWLFADDRDDDSPDLYPDPIGQPAKDEFLRRLSVLEEKYCGPSSVSETEDHQASTNSASNAAPEDSGAITRPLNNSPNTETREI